MGVVLKIGNACHYLRYTGDIPRQDQQYKPIITCYSGPE